MPSARDQIRREIAESGPIPFARFMALALYCPLCGYYEKKGDTPGRRGDFYTSVSVGPLFGELLAFQFAEWLATPPARGSSPRIAAAGEPAAMVVEAGAHDGRLARDILGWLQARRPELFARIEYWILEPSPRRQEWQRETLRAFDPKIRWFAGLHLLKPRTVRGVIFANELLDALPVRRIGWDARRRAWFEWGVALDRERFVWTRLPAAIVPPDFTIPVSREVLEALPDGFTVDSSPDSARWWTEAAQRLERGRLLTVDYGLNAEDFLSPQRAQGTLRAYHRHRLVSDVLANPGEQDLTAHVNFTWLRTVGERAGLATETDCSQAGFLTAILQHAWRTGDDFKPWTGERTRQFQTLTHPEHLGRAFRVLVQSRNGG
jgi:SAM-dependent MidA family methyltransferase